MRSPFVFASAVLIVLAGCGKEEIETYVVAEPSEPSEQETASDAAPMPNLDSRSPVVPQNPNAGNSGRMQELPGMAESTERFATPEMAAPEHWKRQEAGTIRKASWQVSKDGQSADVAVTAFPGDVGGDLANVNRWRRQVGLPPTDQADIAEIKEERAVDVDGNQGYTVFLEGPQGRAILGAIVPRGEGTWFFKMTGPAELLRAEEDGFMNLLSSVDWSNS